VIPVSRQIIDYVLAAVTAEALAAMPSLISSQIHVLDETQPNPESLPDIEVWLGDDHPKEETGEDSAGGEDRILTFCVAIAAKSLAEADTDVLAMAVRKAVLGGLPCLGGLALHVSWGPQEWGIGATSTPTVFTKLTFTATYYWSPEW
jgi:hypothetical protein